MHIRSVLLSLTILATSIAAAPAMAHAHLEQSEPKAAAVLEQAPQQLKLRFSQVLELPFSSIELSDSANKVIALSKLEADKDDPKTVVVTVPQLTAGTYRVQWATMTRDSHRTKGEFSFTVK